MLKRRSRWLAGAAGLFLVLSMSGVAMAVPPPDEVPEVDTTSTFEDVDGNGIDDDCQAETAVAAPEAVTAEQATVDTNADGVISTTEAAHSSRTGGKNCNHGGYVSWVAHQNGDCATEPTEETTEPTEACEPVDETDEGADADAAKKDHRAAAAARLAAKVERKLAHAAAKAERANAREASKADKQAAKAERNAARAAKQAERHAAKAARSKNKN